MTMSFVISKGGPHEFIDKPLCSIDHVAFFQKLKGYVLILSDISESYKDLHLVVAAWWRVKHRPPYLPKYFLLRTLK